MKKLALYLPIFRYVADAFVNKLIEIDSKEDLEIWMNTPGGSVYAGWGIIGPLKDREGKTNAKVYGDASSMGMYMLLFMDHISSIDVSNFTIHRAASYNERESEEEKAEIIKINKQLREKMEKKIDAEVFKQVTGKTLDDIFNMDTRINVNLTAKQAKKVGLIDEIIRLEPNTKQAKSLTERFVAFVDDESIQSQEGEDVEIIEVRESTAKKPQPKEVKPKKTSQMTRDELKAQNPEVYNAIYNSGIEAGKAQEKDRTEAYLEFIDTDAEAVKKGIEDGKPISQKFMAEMYRKGMSPKKLEEAVDDSPEEIAAKKEEGKLKTAEQKEVEATAKEVAEAAGLKIEEV